MAITARSSSLSLLVVHQQEPWSFFCFTTCSDTHKKREGHFVRLRVQDNVIRTGHHRHPFVHKEIVFWKLEREREREDGKIVGLLSARGRFIV